MSLDTTFCKITEIVCVIWLVKNYIGKTRYWSANNDFKKAKKQTKLLTVALFNIKSVGFHILLLRVTICDCHSFRSYKVQSLKAVYISRRCQIAEKPMPLYYIGRTCRASVKYSRTRTFVHLNNLDSSFGHKDRKLHTFPDTVTRTSPVMPSRLCPFVVRIS